MKLFKPAVVLVFAASMGGCAVVPAEPVAPPAPVQAPVAPPAPAPAPAATAGVAGIATTGTDRWYKDQYARCYRVDERGDRVYDAARQC